MPRIANDSEFSASLGGSFNFTGTRIENLGATEYTLVTVAIDVTGSTAAFADELRTMLVTAVRSCQKSPRSNNLLARVVTFSSSIGGVQEIHGFRPLTDINPDDYPHFQPSGMTPLFDAVYSAVGATAAYGQQLKDNDFLANAIAFIITDGADNVSSVTPRTIANEIARLRSGEVLESFIGILIGVNAAGCARELDRFRVEAALDQYIEVGDVTPGKLAKLAAFVSQSVSSQSQSVGTGGPSQNISTTI